MLSFKVISIFNSSSHFDYNCLCNLGREHYEEHLLNCFEFGKEVQMLFIDFSIFSSGIHFVQWSRPICATFIEGIMGNICNRNLDK